MKRDDNRRAAPGPLPGARATPARSSAPDGGSTKSAGAGKRPDVVPPGMVSRIVYFVYAAIGLYFAIHNTDLIVRQMAAPEEAPGFAAAALFFCMGMIPTVFLLYLTAGLKVALIDRLGVKTIFVIGVVIVLFSLLLWSVLTVSQADVRATVIGFFVPTVIRVTFQDPAETGNEANQRILVYFGGMIGGLAFMWVFRLLMGHDLHADGENFAFASVVLLSQVLQVWHATLQLRGILGWQRQET